MDVIAVTSGKGGVGKTNVAVNLAVGLARMGRQVVLFDADLGLANIDLVLGLRPTHDVRHVLSGEKQLEEILVHGPGGIRIVPATSGVARMAELSLQQRAGLIQAFSELTIPVDTLIVDTAAGVDSGVLTFSSACEKVVVVVCDEPTSITDAYALIKLLNKEYDVKEFHLLANMVERESQGLQLYDKLHRVADQFLDVHLGYLGAVPRDGLLRRAVQQQGAVLDIYPRSNSAQALLKVAGKLCDGAPSGRGGGGLGFFVERLFNRHPAGAEA